MPHILFYSLRHRRSKTTLDALQQSAGVLGGVRTTVIDEKFYTGPDPTADIVVFYGLKGNLMRIFQDYRARGVCTVFWDLAHAWGRKGECREEFERFAVREYMPTSYMSKQYPVDRYRYFNRQIKPWQKDGREILLFGMSQKSATVWGLGNATDHARKMIEEIRRYTDRPLAYRPKMSWPEAQPIPGTRYATGPLAQELAQAFVTVTYQSNSSILALEAGIPVIVLGDGPARLMGHTSIEQIESPLYPEDREQFFADLCYQQCSFREMRDGTAWRLMQMTGQL